MTAFSWIIDTQTLELEKIQHTPIDQCVGRPQQIKFMPVKGIGSKFMMFKTRFDHEIVRSIGP